MKKVTVIGAIMVMLLLAHWAQAGVSLIRNGSFEDDGWIDDIWETEPNGWDVNGPNDKFGGYVHAEWPTDGNFNLTLYSEWVEFEVNDMATVSQEVCLTDVNHIIFDLKLDTYFGPPPSIGTVWDPNKCTAVLLIDGNVVWESNSVGSDVRDEYYNRTYTVEEKYKVAGPNTLSLGMRVNVAESLGDYYMTHWDFIGFYDLPCRGDGLLAGDFDRDCYVDMYDLKMLAEQWLEEEIDEKYDLFEDDENFVNFRDFAIFASYWQDNTCQQPDWCGGSDFDQSGVVDSVDLMMFAENWLRWFVLLSDLNEDGVVNFEDFAIFADNWLKSSYEQSE